jgi:hypothetical protein
MIGRIRAAEPVVMGLFVPNLEEKCRRTAERRPRCRE